MSNDPWQDPERSDPCDAWSSWRYAVGMVMITALLVKPVDPRAELTAPQS